MRSFEKVKMASAEHMSFAVEAILHCLEDADMVVRLEAGLAFRGLLRHEIGVFLPRHFPLPRLGLHSHPMATASPSLVSFLPSPGRS